LGTQIGTGHRPARLMPDEVKTRRFPPPMDHRKPQRCVLHRDGRQRHECRLRLLRGRTRTSGGGEPVDQGRSATDRGQYRQAARCATLSDARIAAGRRWGASGSTQAPAPSTVGRALAGRGGRRTVGVFHRWRPLAARHQSLVRGMPLERPSATVGARPTRNGKAGNALTSLLRLVGVDDQGEITSQAHRPRPTLQHRPGLATPSCAELPAGHNRWHDATTEGCQPPHVVSPPA
jgi:hypothetical protein